jgi:hypothetical protein
MESQSRGGGGKTVSNLRRIVAGIRLLRPRFDSRSCGVYDGRMEMGQVFTECFGLPSQFSSATDSL